MVAPAPQLLQLLALACVAPLVASHRLFRLRIDKESQAIIKAAHEDVARWTSEAQSVREDKEKVQEEREEEFWTMQWQTLESEAFKLERSLTPHVSAFLQTSKQPAHSQAVLDSIKGQVKGLMGKAALAPMLSMLKGMYADQKKRIGTLNKQEKESKARFDKQQKEYQERVKYLEDKAKAHKLDAEFVKNGTAEYKRQFTYWQHVRERNHRQYHNTLKITHGMMEREKNMISQYEKALAMPDPAASASKAPAKAAKPEEAPEVVLEQQRVEFKKFCRDSLVEIHSAMEPESKRHPAPMRGETRLV